MIGSLQHKSHMFLILIEDLGANVGVSIRKIW